MKCASCLSLDRDCATQDFTRAESAICEARATAEATEDVDGKE